MLRLLCLTSALLAMSVMAASADPDDVMAGFYGNTAVATGGPAVSYSIYKPDHTFVVKVPDFGVTFSGQWQITGTKLCRTYDTPPPNYTNPSCTPIAAHKVGDVWTVQLPDGERTVTLVAGEM